MFPVFELVRRVFLSAVLTMLLPGTLSQVAVRRCCILFDFTQIGLLGALISHRVFTYYSPYIEDTDDVVSEVAQTQLVLIYFSACRT